MAITCIQAVVLNSQSKSQSRSFDVFERDTAMPTFAGVLRLCLHSLHWVSGQRMLPVGVYVASVSYSGKGSGTPGCGEDTHPCLCSSSSKAAARRSHGDSIQWAL